MNREDAKRLLPFIQAFADGAELQYKGRNKRSFGRVDFPIWCADGEYRIAPKPIKMAWEYQAERIDELERWQITECPFHKIPLLSWNGEYRYCPHSNCHWPHQYPKTIAKAQESEG
jgi:hypothetical protein